MLDEDRIDVGEADEQATEIDLDAPAPEQSLEEEEVQVEEVIEDDSQPADASAESDQQSAVQKSELDEYSEGVQKRIAKLTRKMREAERQKDEALGYAEKMIIAKKKAEAKLSKLEPGYLKSTEDSIVSGMQAAQATCSS